MIPECTDYASSSCCLGNNVTKYEKKVALNTLALFSKPSQKKTFDAARRGLKSTKLFFRVILFLYVLLISFKIKFQRHSAYFDWKFLKIQVNVAFDKMTFLFFNWITNTFWYWTDVWGQHLDEAVSAWIGSSLAMCACALIHIKVLSDQISVVIVYYLH